MKLARRFRATSSLFIFGARRGIKKSLSLWFVRDKAFIINSSRTGGLFARAVFYAGGFLVKPRQTPGGMIHFWGDFSLAFSAPTLRGVPRKVRQDWVFRLIFQAENPLFYFAGTC